MSDEKVGRGIITEAKQIKRKIPTKRWICIQVKNIIIMTMSKQNQNLCCSCRSPRTEGTCELCGEPVCRQCINFVPTDTFSFLEERPENLSHSRYCRLCHMTHIEPALVDYESTMAQAREVIIITKAYRGFLPVLKKAKTEITVSGCPDRDETILRLAFKATQQGYNAVIFTDVTSQKVRNHSYQKSIWNGHGLPASLDEGKLRESDQREEVWRRGK